jgi:hypothetical protein
MGDSLARLFSKLAFFRAADEINSTTAADTLVLTEERKENQIA